MADDGKNDGRSSSDWVGDWFAPEIGKKYYVPELVSNHKQFAGKTAKCTDKRSNGFGMHWAYLVVAEPDLTSGWVRTCFMQPTPVD